MIQALLRATPEGTAAFRSRFAQQTAEDFFRPAGEILLSCLGQGTLRGELDDYSDDLIHDAAVLCVQGGCNVLESGIHFRHQRSQRALGRALQTIFQQKLARREELFVIGRIGVIPYDRLPPANPDRYLEERFLLPGLASAEEIVAGEHCIQPNFLEDQLEQSLQNLSLEAIDLMFLQNLDLQLTAVSREVFRSRVLAAFDYLEEEVVRGRLGGYGVASWSGFFEDPLMPGHLSLGEMVELAEEVAGKSHHFQAVQFPVSLLVHRALTDASQFLEETFWSPLDACRRLGLWVFAGSPLAHGLLCEDLPASVRESLPQFPSDAQRALHAVCSIPDITSILTGMNRQKHVRENFQLSKTPSSRWSELEALFS